MANNIWKCSSPRGDGNADALGLTSVYTRFGNVVPREGTETLPRIMPENLFEIIIWKCSSPRGDGNPCSFSSRRISFLFGNVVPREGTETGKTLFGYQSTTIWKCSSPRGDGNPFFTNTTSLNISIWKCSSPRGDGNQCCDNHALPPHIWKCSSPREDGNNGYNQAYKSKWI